MSKKKVVTLQTKQQPDITSLADHESGKRKVRATKSTILSNGKLSATAE